MPRNRTVEPIGPTTIPGEPTDPKIPPDLEPPAPEIKEPDDAEERDESPLG